MRRGALGLAALALSSAACAHEYYTATFQVIHPWTPTAAAGTRAVGLYMRIVDITADDRLLSAGTEVAETVELRHPQHRDPAPASAGIALSAGRELSLSPFTAHLVLRGLKTELHQGRQYPLRLVFEKAGEVPVDFVVGAH